MLGMLVILLACFLLLIRSPDGICADSIDTSIPYYPSMNSGICSVDNNATTVATNREPSADADVTCVGRKVKGNAKAVDVASRRIPFNYLVGPKRHHFRLPKGILIRQFHARNTYVGRSLCVLTAADPDNNDAGSIPAVKERTRARCYIGPLDDRDSPLVEVPVVASGPGAYYAQVTVSSSLGCGILTTGHIQCWPLRLPSNANEVAFLSSVPTAANFVQVFLEADEIRNSPAECSACALTFEGSMVCWPIPLSPLVGVAPAPLSNSAVPSSSFTVADPLMAIIASRDGFYRNGAFKVTSTPVMSPDGDVACTLVGEPSRVICWGKGISTQRIRQIGEGKGRKPDVITFISRFTDIAKGFTHTVLVGLIMSSTAAADAAHYKIGVWYLSDSPLASDELHAVFYRNLNSTRAVFEGLAASSGSYSSADDARVTFCGIGLQAPMFVKRSIQCFASPYTYLSPDIPVATLNEIAALTDAGGWLTPKVYMSPCRRCVLVTIPATTSVGGTKPKYNLVCWAPSVGASYRCRQPIVISDPTQVVDSLVVTVGDNFVCVHLYTVYGASCIEATPALLTFENDVHSHKRFPVGFVVAINPTIACGFGSLLLCWRGYEQNNAMGALLAKVHYSSLAYARDTACGVISNSVASSSRTLSDRVVMQPINGVFCSGQGAAARTFPMVYDSESRGMYAGGLRQCPAGTYSFGEGSVTSMCSGLCATGTWGDGTDLTQQCKGPCPQGYACPRQHEQWHRSRRVCSPGTFQGRVGQTTCLVCGAGKFTAHNASAECVDCAPGTFQPNPHQSTCSMCSAGSFQPSAGTSQCFQCAPGRFSSNVGATLCRECPPNSFAANPNSKQCTPCPAGEFTAKNAAGSMACMACPPGSELRDGSCHECLRGTFRSSLQTKCSACSIGKFAAEVGSATCRTCADGHTALSSGQVQCLPCSPEWICLNGEEPSLKSGFWPIGNGSLSSLLAAAATSSEKVGLIAFPCPEGLCTSGEPGKSCGVGRLDPPSANVLCGRCAGGYALVGSKCIECSGTNWWAVFAVLGGAMLFVSVTLFQARSSSSGRYTSFLYFVQTALLMLGPYRNWLSWLSVFNFAPDQAVETTGTCVASISPVHSLLLGVGMPILFSACLAAVVGIRHGIDKLREFHRSFTPPSSSSSSSLQLSSQQVIAHRTRRRATVARTVIMLYLFAYTRMAVLVTTYLRCQKVGRHSVVYLVPAIDCESDAYLAWRPLIILVLVAYLVVAPCGMLFWLWRQRHTLDHAATQRVWGVLYEPYLPTRYYAGVLVLFRRAIMVATNIIFVLDAETRAMVFCIFNVGFLCLHLWLKPFKNATSNRIEAVLLWLLTVLSALLTSHDRPLSTGIAVAVSLVVSVPSILCILYFALDAVLECRHRRRRSVKSGKTPFTDCCEKETTKDIISRPGSASVSPKPSVVENSLGRPHSNNQPADVCMVVIDNDLRNE